MVSAAGNIGLSINAQTVAMVFNPTGNRKNLHVTFSPFSAQGSNLSFVTCFKYLGHITEDTLCDDSDINRELKSLFARANLLNRRFGVVLMMSSCSFSEAFVYAFMILVRGDFIELASYINLPLHM